MTSALSDATYINPCNFQVTEVNASQTSSLRPSLNPPIAFPSSFKAFGGRCRQGGVRCVWVWLFAAREPPVSETVPTTTRIPDAGRGGLPPGRLLLWRPFPDLFFSLSFKGRSRSLDHSRLKLLLLLEKTQKEGEEANTQFAQFQARYPRVTGWASEVAFHPWGARGDREKEGARERGRKTRGEAVGREKPEAGGARGAAPAKSPSVFSGSSRCLGVASDCQPAQTALTPPG